MKPQIKKGKIKKKEIFFQKTKHQIKKGKTKKERNIFSKTLDKSTKMWYHIKVAASEPTERWLSWSKAHDWKSCVG